MKNFLFPVLCTALFVVATSCGSTNTGGTTQTTATSMQKEENKLKGTWTLANYSYDNQNGTILVEDIFNQADITCFKGSTWNFIPNNASGSYTLNGGGKCSGTTNFRWIIKQNPDGNYFEFKKSIEGIKDKKNVIGYAMKLVNIDDSSMTMVQQIPFEGTPISITYNFIKN